MPSPGLAGRVVLYVMASLLMTVAVGAQEVQLIAPPNGAITGFNVTFDWQDYPGAASYAYWLEDPVGQTWPVGSTNPHLVGSQSQVTLNIIHEAIWRWYIIAYSDSAGTNEIARSATWEVTTSANPPTATPSPTPRGQILPAPELIRPPDKFEFTVDAYNNTSGLYQWKPVSGAASYEVEITFPNLIARTFIVSGTSIEWTQSPPSGYRTTLTGTYLWRVRARTAQAEAGDWSETRQLQLSFAGQPNPADLNDDGRLDLLDLFTLTRSWQVALDEPGWNANADFDSSQLIDEKDMLIFVGLFRNGRVSPPVGTVLPAPNVLGPPDGSVFNRQRILDGLDQPIKIEWEPIPDVRPSYYRIQFAPEAFDIIVVRDVFQGTSYTLTENDMFQTALGNNQPVKFSVRAVGPSGEPGLPSPQRKFTIITTATK